MSNFTNIFAIMSKSWHMPKFYIITSRLLTTCILVHTVFCWHSCRNLSLFYFSLLLFKNYGDQVKPKKNVVVPVFHCVQIPPLPCVCLPSLARRWCGDQVSGGKFVFTHYFSAFFFLFFKGFTQQRATTHSCLKKKATI